MTNIPFKQMPTYMLRDGSAIPGGVEGYVFLLLVNRMATKAGSYRYKGLNVPLLENQVCCTLQDIAKVTGYTTKRVRTAVKNLQEKSILGKAEGKATKGNLSIYTINFAPFEKPEWQSYGQTKGKPRANQGQTELKTIETAKTTPPNGGEPLASPHDGLDLDGILFKEGKRILGQKAGGFIVRLKDAFGKARALELIQEADKKENPSEYVGAALKNQQPSGSRVVSNGDFRIEADGRVTNLRKSGRGSIARGMPGWPSEPEAAASAK